MGATTTDRLVLAYFKRRPTIQTMSGFLLPPVESWADWGAIFTDEALWRPVIEQVWAHDERLPALTGVSNPGQARAGYPGTCAVFVIDTVIIKFYPPVVEGDFERERAVYRLLSGRVANLPTLLADGVFHDRIDWPYIVISRIAGEPWRDVRSRLSAAEQQTIMAQLGRVVRAAHDTPLPAAGDWPNARGWAAFVRERLPHIAAELRQQTALSETIIDEIMAFLDTTDWFAVPPVLLHADLSEDHPLLAKTGGRWTLVGLIDWADAMVGDPLYDAVAVWFSICRGDAALFRAFQEGYGSGFGSAVDLPDRLLAMTFLHEFNTDIMTEALSLKEQRAIQTFGDLKAALLGDLLS